jgi:hypothetical protein
MARLTFIFAIGTLLLLSALTGAGTGCASSYKAIQPLNLAFENDMPMQGDSLVVVAYRYNVLRESGNDRYADMEKRRGFCVLGMRIDNQSADTLYFPENFAFFNGTMPVEPLPLYFVDKPISQESNEDVVVLYPSYYLGDPLLDIPTFINMAVAVDADSKMRKEFEAYYLVYSTIPPNTAVQGIVAFPVQTGAVLTVKKR